METVFLDLRAERIAKGVRLTITVRNLNITPIIVTAPDASRPYYLTLFGEPGSIVASNYSLEKNGVNAMHEVRIDGQSEQKFTVIITNQAHLVSTEEVMRVKEENVQATAFIYVKQDEKMHPVHSMLISVNLEETTL